MANRRNWIGMLIMVLVFGMAVIGCDNGSTEEEDIWSDVTSFSQLDGSWKTSSSSTLSMDLGEYGIITSTNKYKNYITSFNSTNKTQSISGTITSTYSGENVKSFWQMIKGVYSDESLEMMKEQGMTININDSNYSITVTYNNYTDTSWGLINDADFQSLFSNIYQINQNRTKIKIKCPDGIGFTGETILTKQ